MLKRITIALLLVCGGCGRGSRMEIIKVHGPSRETQLARKHNIAAIEHLRRGRLDQAASEIQLALKADDSYGPAHNTSGMIYYRQNKLNDAAKQLNLAIAQMPRDASARHNLGLVWEAAGLRNKAVTEYIKALKVDPEHMQSTGNLARCYVVMGRRDQVTRDLLQEIILKDTRPKWTQWARDTLAVMSESDKKQGIKDK